MTLAIRWRIPDRALVTRWRGPEGMSEIAARTSAEPLAAIIGPPGPVGPQGPIGAPLRLDAPLAATWILAHTLGRVPTVQVYLSTGENVLTDVVATSAQITVTFPAPRQGFVLAY